MGSCSICGDETELGELTHLRIYVTGSEGIEVCLTCRMKITEFVKTLREMTAKGILKGVKMMKRDKEKEK